jgi:AcrR family transcriptional regulator
MGNREDLLAGAERCLYEKGYARTSARDIAAAAGVSLAAIGYHYGSKDALLNAALQTALERWGDDVGRALVARAGTSDDPATQFQATWAAVLASFEQSRPLWAIQFELLAHLERNPQLRQTFAGANRRARAGLAELFGAVDDEDQTIGTFLQVLLGGTAAQWLADPSSAPNGETLLKAIRTLAAALPRTAH